MDWTDYPIIEQTPGKMSGSPVLRGTRLRPQDIVGNAMMGEEWIAEAFGVCVENVRTVLAFNDQNGGGPGVRLSKGPSGNSRIVMLLDVIGDSAGSGGPSMPSG